MIYLERAKPKKMTTPSTKAATTQKARLQHDARIKRTATEITAAAAAQKCYNGTHGGQTFGGK